MRYLRRLHMKKHITHVLTISIMLYCLMSGVLLSGVISLPVYATPHDELLNAVKDGDIQAVQTALTHGADVNTKDKHGGTLLMWAAYHGHREIVKLLLQYDVDLDAKSDKGNTALMVAEFQQHTEIVQLLKAAAAQAHQGGTKTMNNEGVAISLRSPAEGAIILVPPGTVKVTGHVNALTKYDLDVVFVLDLSKSTKDPTGADFDGDGSLDTILDAEKFAVYQKITELEALNRETGRQLARVGIVGFYGSAMSASDLTARFDQARMGISRLGYQSWTNFQAGIEHALALFTTSPRPQAQKVLMFLSDGKPNKPDNDQAAREAALAAAERAKQQGVMIQSFAIGSEQVTAPVTLREMAMRTGGRFTQVTHPKDLPQVFAQTSFVNIHQVTIEAKNMATGEVVSSFSVVPTSTGVFSQTVSIGQGHHTITLRAQAENGTTGSQSVVVTGVIPTPPAPRIPRDGLIAYYPFTGNVNDESGNELHGQVQGATLTSDRFGQPDQAYLFNPGNNATDTIEIHDHQLLKFREYLTISVWVKPSVPSEFQTILNKWYALDSYSLRMYNDYYEFAIAYRGGEWGKQYVVRATHPVAVEQWTHVVGVFDGQQGTLRLYINGTLEHEAVIPQGELQQSTRPVSIGNHPSTDAYKGSIDEIRLYNRVLDDEDIQWLYQER